MIPWVDGCWLLVTGWVLPPTILDGTYHNNEDRQGHSATS